MASATDLLSLLQRRGLLNEAEVRRLRQESQSTGRPPIVELQESGRVRDDQILAELRRRRGLVEVDPSDETVVDIEALRWLSQSVAEAHLVLPVRIERRGAERVMFLAMADPLHHGSIEAVEEASGHVVEPLLAQAGPLVLAVSRLYGRITTQLIPRSTTQPMHRADGWAVGEGEPETQPVHRLEDEATPAQLVHALVRALERKGLLDRAEFMEALKAVLRGEGDP